MKADIKLECEAHQFPFNESTPEQFKIHAADVKYEAGDWLVKLPWNVFIVVKGQEFVSKLSPK